MDREAAPPTVRDHLRGSLTLLMLTASDSRVSGMRHLRHHSHSSTNRRSQACATYAANFPDESSGAAGPVGDICDVDPAHIPRHDILTAGFPCQPFSCAGDQKGMDDERRGHLFYEASSLPRHCHVIDQ